MLCSDFDIRRLMALRAVEAGLLRLKWLAAATRFELAMVRHHRALKLAYKAGFNRDQPRDEYGKWTDSAGTGAETSGDGGTSTVSATATEIGSRIRVADAGGLINTGVMSDASPIPVASGSTDVQGDPAAPGNRAKSTPTDVVLPDGSKIPDPKSSTGYLQSPSSDLAVVARAGRETGAAFKSLSENSETAGAALPFLTYSMRRDLNQGGTYDYQRDGSTYLKDYEHVSNFNVGLYSQQAGLSLSDTLSIAGAYGKYFLNNPQSRDSYGLTNDQRTFMELGYRAGQSGGFGSRP